MTKTSDVLYGRRGGRMAPGTHDRAEDAIATIARERAKARKAHAAGHGPPWPGDLPATAELGHPATIAHARTLTRIIAERHPHGLPSSAADRRAAYETAEHLIAAQGGPDPAALADAWLHRARMADARRAAGVALDATDLDALARHPDPPGILTLAERTQP